MAVLGISGFFTTETNDYAPTTFSRYSHDATACIVHNGQTLAAVEEERLNRDKHTFRFPEAAVPASLEISGIDINDVSRVAYYFEESYIDSCLSRIGLEDPFMTLRPVRAEIIRNLEIVSGRRFDIADLVFVNHHEAHAASAFYDSGYDRALVLVSDGNGERDGVSIFEAGVAGLKLLRSYSRVDSLGDFYTTVTKMIGYREFDEYKVMGLASFGSAETYRSALSPIYSVQSDGRYCLPTASAIKRLLELGFVPRRYDEPITQDHKDLAAAAQEIIETITKHIVDHWTKVTGIDQLCIVGGVAQNTSLNGKLLKSSNLRSVYVPSAANDAGAALGAAILTDRAENPASISRRYTRTPYLGPSVGSDNDVARELKRWSGFVEYRKVDQIELETAKAIADGAIVGWVQGRSEFGPRALGNRSIVADPRPAANRDRVNRLIKKREDYRPFAPVVRSGDAERYFDLGDVLADHSFMGFVVPVRQEYREHLGATTHVDGTSRIQVLSENANPRFWRLITEFGAITGTPVLLNTSFNNASEPIVQSFDDAMATFITANLTMLIAGTYMIERATNLNQAIAQVPIQLPKFVKMTRSSSKQGNRAEIFRTASPNKPVAVSEAVASLISRRAAISDLSLAGGDLEQTLMEVKSLWDRRLISLIP